MRGLGGAYFNSFSRASLVLGAGVYWEPSRYILLGASFGVATGYYELARSPPLGALPMAMQVLAVGTRSVKATVYHIPGAVGFGVTVPIKKSL